MAAGTKPAELRELSEDAPRLAKPLRQFLQTIDDRERSVENDPAHKELAPPAELLACLTTPEELFSRPGVAARVIDIDARTEHKPIHGPDRDQLLALVA